MDWVYGAGVDTIENFVWANVTHFSDYSTGGLHMQPSVGITRGMPSTIKTNQKFDTTLHPGNLADFGLFNISVKEKTPEGYRLREAEKISPRPVYIRNESGSTVIYWLVDRLANHANLSLNYSFNVTKQEVKKPPLWKSVLEFFGFILNSVKTFFNTAPGYYTAYPASPQVVPIF